MNIKTIILVIIVNILLTGCFYPNERRVENQTPYPDQIAIVQQSVNQYKEDTGVLPIDTKEADTPIYEKYVLDFKTLIPRYLSRPPGNSFAEGGSFLYVLVDVEENPQVRLLDLRLTQEVRNLQLRVNEYLSRHTYLPIDEILENGYFTLDYKELKLKNTPLVQSPYSREFLPFIVNNDGRVGIDYRLDLYQIIQQEAHNFEESEDIRHLLVQDSYFVPAHSFPVTVKDGELVLK